MSDVRTFAQHAVESDAPFFHTFPLWVVDALAQKGKKAADVRVIKVMPKTAEVSFVDTSDPSRQISASDANAVQVLKLRRKDAFPGRSAE
jgi:hypothetical protein